jgi:hypothetical protein
MFDQTAPASGLLAKALEASCKTGRLVYLGLNNWTFIPSVAYTKIVPEANIELTGIWDMEFSTENPATHYENGILSGLEVLAIKRFKCGLGIGFVERFSRPRTTEVRRPINSMVSAGALSALARSLPTPQSWARATSI